MQDPIELRIAGNLVAIDVDEIGRVQIRVYRNGEHDPVGVLDVAADDRDEAVGRRSVAITWAVEDVLSVRPDLTPAQAWEVLQACRDRHDCNHGMTWETIADMADVCFPPAVA